MTMIFGREETDCATRVVAASVAQTIRDNARRDFFISEQVREQRKVPSLGDSGAIPDLTHRQFA